MDLEENECIALYLKPVYDLNVIESGQDYASAMLNGLYMALHLRPRYRSCISITCEAELLADEVSHDDKEKYIRAAFKTVKKWLKHPA